MRNTYRISVAKPGRKRPLGRSRRGWEYYVTTGPKQIEKGSFGRTYPGQGRDEEWAAANTAMNLRVPHKAEGFLTC
jgi:hypothetical protein